MLGLWADPHRPRFRRGTGIGEAPDPPYRGFSLGGPSITTAPKEKPGCPQRANQYLLRFVSLLFRGGGSDPAV